MPIVGFGTKPMYSFREKKTLGVKNMKKIALMLSAIFLMGMVAAVMPIAATTTTTPLYAKQTFTGITLNAFDSDYDSRDYIMVSGNQINLDAVVEDLVLPDDDVSVNLAETCLISDAAIDSEDDFSSTFINSTFNTAVESSAPDVHVDSQLTSSYADVRMDANVRFNTSGVETAAWYSYLATDTNGDGDYEDSADKHYRISIGGQGQYIYWNALADWNVTDDDNYLLLTWSFKTTGNDYDMEIYFYTGSGDSAWSNIDSAAEDKCTLSLYDTDNTAIALAMDIAEVIQMDLGDNPSISGLNELIVEVGTDNAAAEVDVRINNFAVFTDIPAATDKTDNDDDWDLNGAAGGLWTGLWDDNDFLITEVTEGATESYDSTVPLYTKIEVSPYAMPQDAKYIQFTGNVYCFPQEWSVSSDVKDGYYETSEIWTFDSTSIDDFKTPANVFTWTDVYYNMTLTQDILYSGFEDFEDDLILFELEGTDKTEEVRTLWDAADDDAYKIAYDGTNPDTTTGSSYDFLVIYRSDAALDEDAGVPVVAEAVDNTMLIIGIGIVVVLVLGLIYAVTVWRKPKRKRGGR